LAYYAHHGVPAIALQRTPASEVERYGCVTGAWDDTVLPVATGTASASGDSGVFVDTVVGDRESSSGEAMLRRSIKAAAALGDAVESMETIGSDLRAKIAEVREMLASAVGEQMLPRSLQVRLRSIAFFAPLLAQRQTERRRGRRVSFGA
jgi:hypothetical protein